MSQVVVAFRVPNFDPHASAADAQSIDDYWEGYSALLEALLQQGKTVYVVYPIPELPDHIVKLAYPVTIFGSEPLLDLDQGQDRRQSEARAAEFVEKLNGLTWSAQLIAIRSADILCTATHCPGRIGSHPLYFDEDHLSVHGAGLLADVILHPSPEASSGY